jgi:membrane carboxypeptidase/penicillin-binding protein
MYATALEKGYTASTLIMDVSTEFYTGDDVDKPYTPVNYDGKFKGPVQMRFALGNSLNIPAVKMLAKVGLKSVMQKAFDMGIENWQPTNEAMRNVGLSLVLGGREASLLEMTRAYSVLANKGVKKESLRFLKLRIQKEKLFTNMRIDLEQKFCLKKLVLLSLTFCLITLQGNLFLVLILYL